MRYRLLGPIEVANGDHRIDLGGPKQRAVLALLLLQPGRVVSTDRIIQAVWGDDPPGSVTAGLQAYISNLRRALRGDRQSTPIVRQPPGYLISLHPGDDLDVAVFAAACDRARAAVETRDWPTVVEAAEHALDLAAQPLAAEFADEEWVQGPALALAERRAAAQQNLVAGLLGRGRIDAALSRSTDMVAEQALTERAWWLHLVALYRAGRAAEALEAYRVHAEHLDAELGLEPGPALRDVQGAILRQDPDLMAWPNAVRTGPVVPPVLEPQAPTPPAPAEQERRAGPTFVGRRRELAVVRATLAEAVTEGPSWLVLTGPAGMGKTRLAEEGALFWTAEGGQLLRATCPDDETMPSWWPLRQMMRACGVDPQAVLAPPPEVDADEARFVVYERIREVVGHQARRAPLLILVEDAHWADLATLQFMRFVAEIEQQLPLAVLVTVRDGEGGPELARLLAAIARRPHSRQLALPPLNRPEVAALASLIGGAPLSVEDAEQLRARTGGNPFFVSEYARLPEEERARGEVPGAIRSVLGRRLAGLDSDVLQVLRTAAVLGDPFDLELLTGVGRLDPDELDDLLDEAADERIIVADPTGRYMFAHALLRDEVLAGMSAVRRQRLHLRVAEAMGTDCPPDRFAARAGHLMAALPLSDPGVALEACRSAALHAEADWHYDAAAAWWEHALRASDLISAASADPVAGGAGRDELAIAQISALAHSGRGTSMLEAVDQALLESVRGGRLEATGRLAATLLRSTGAWPWAVYGADPGPLLARLAGLQDVVRPVPSAHARLLAALAVGSCYDPDGNVPEMLSRQALELAEQLGDPDVLADAMLGRLLTKAGIAASAQESLQLAGRLTALPHRMARVDEVLCHNLLSMVELSLGRLDTAALHLREGVVGADVLRMPVSRVQLRWFEGTLTLWHGDIERAEAIQAHADSMHRQTELYEVGAFDLAHLSDSWATGRTPNLTRELAANPFAALWVGMSWPASDGPAIEAFIAAEVRRAEPVNWLTHARLTLLAHEVADRHLVELAGPLRRSLTPYQHLIANLGQTGVVGTVDLALARLALVLNDIPGAEAALESARHLAQRSYGRPELLRCQLFDYELQAHRGRSVEPAHLSALVDRADAAGLRGLADRARALRDAGPGALPPAHHATSRHATTPSGVLTSR